MAISVIQPWVASDPYPPECARSRTQQRSHAAGALPIRRSRRAGLKGTGAAVRWVMIANQLFDSSRQPLEVGLHP